MEFKSIFFKVLFLVSIILAFLCCIDNSALNGLIQITIIPLFIINILIVINSINLMIIDKTSELKQFYKEFENDDTISKEEQNKGIKKEVIYDRISRFFEISINRFVSNIMVIIVVVLFLLIIFQNQIFVRINRFNDVISILSCTVLIIEVAYKEKIANKIIDKLYIHENKKFKDD